MTKFKSMLPFLLINALAFYLLPLPLRGELGNTGLAMLLLLVGIPLVCFICAAIYGTRNSFHVLYGVFVAIIFAPSIFIFYNYTAWVYSVAYGVIALTGNAVGMIVYKLIKK